jgi:hypothetical protein
MPATWIAKQARREARGRAAPSSVGRLAARPCLTRTARLVGCKPSWKALDTRPPAPQTDPQARAAADLERRREEMAEQTPTPPAGDPATEAFFADDAGADEW